MDLQGCCDLEAFYRLITVGFEGVLGVLLRVGAFGVGATVLGFYPKVDVV